MSRSPAEEIRIEARRLKVAELYLHGTRCLSQIARELGVDKAQISRDFKQIRKLWRERYIEDWDAAKHEELAKIAEIEQKAWLAWERSCKDGETMEVTGTSQGGKGKPDTRWVTHATWPFCSSVRSSAGPSWGSTLRRS